jgi:hypothetical protein
MTGLSGTRERRRRSASDPASIADFSSARGWPTGHDDYEGGLHDIKCAMASSWVVLGRSPLLEGSTPLPQAPPRAPLPPPPGAPSRNPATRSRQRRHRPRRSTPTRRHEHRQRPARGHALRQLRIPLQANTT